MLLHSLVLKQRDSMREQMAKWLGTRPTGEFESRLESCELFDTSNVAEYLFSSDERDVFDVARDFPTIRPPFPSIWFERCAVPSMNVGGRLTKPVLGQPASLRSGTYVFSEEQPDGGTFLSFFTFFLKNKMAVLYPVVYGLQIDRLGQIVAAQNGSPYIAIVSKSITQEDAQDLSESLVSVVGYVLLSLSFLNCKNVTIQRRYTNDHVAKASRQKQNGIRYHVLKIDPMKQVLRSEGQSDSIGLKMALHICRGHFKDYSKGGGLFGKYKGLYWWDSYVRGELSNGAVVKDYSVNSPIGNQS